MAKKVQLVNNFAKFKPEFKIDTGLDADQNMSLYVQYVNARLADYNIQMSVHTMGEIIKLPGSLAASVKSSLEKK
jgi:arginyl-tRNA synthetase